MKTLHRSALAVAATALLLSGTPVPAAPPSLAATLQALAKAAGDKPQPAVMLELLKDMREVRKQDVPAGLMPIYERTVEFNDPPSVGNLAENCMVEHPAACSRELAARIKKLGAKARGTHWDTNRDEILLETVMELASLHTNLMLKQTRFGDTDLELRCNYRLAGVLKDQPLKLPRFLDGEDKEIAALVEDGKVSVGPDNISKLTAVLIGYAERAEKAKPAE